ncbi:4-hydroxy-tetrahydrodipicolinate synthase [Hydrogenobaculum acidophilum]
MLTGSITAIITPFKNGEVDYGAFERLIEFQIANNTDGILVCGTSGESPTLSYEEHESVIEFAVKSAKKRIHIMAGTGANSTEEALRFTTFAKAVGADSALLVVPYYNKPTQEGLYRHFSKIAKEVDIDIYIYNIPSRTGIEISVDTLERLAKDYPNIKGSKESTPNMDRISEILKRIPHFTVFSGDDSLTLPMMSLGAKGVVSVVSNVMPKEIKELTSYALKGDFEKARDMHYYLLDMFKIMFIETNPIPVKTALSLMGMVKKEFRLPLCEMLPQNEEKLKEALKRYNLLV